MGLFSKKKADPQPARKDLIPCDKMILSPPESYGKPTPFPKITKEQNVLYRQVLKHFQDENLKLPLNTNDLNNNSTADSTTSSSIGLKPLGPWEKFWLSRECILRYLRATKWNPTHAIKNLTETLVWRREIGLTYDSNDPNQLTPDKIAVENETGKEFLLGFDNAKRPLFYMKNGRQNTEPSFRQVQQLIFMMEAAVSLTPQGVEKITVLVDFKAYKEPGIITDKAPPISIARACLNVMQNHYPERLAKCVLINIPWFAWAFLKLMYPFLDPATKEKAIFDEPFENHIEPSQLEAMYNGRLDFKYNHDVYWPDMNEKLTNKRNAEFKRFEKFGGLIGLSEFDFKGDHEELLYPVEMDLCT
ncbi:phosphatidylinositol transporter NDAI_0F04160 [Naumovozyma dairenensis CBS 421]|uniref:SEC14 homolog 3 n=1 Tax=Naumovozyma dairenensis (strain ATCC 10597 / BCRC 20456 / CBS 421 / NBRC 0211 / NRRL Y-12639) TaxID=1071378 RepID=G0WD73_NAUDC|nr:hypothetical protein NDAI_0F04160 [Naumovozyma dairenensis CBS 421]CCD25734.1 hypothetical protein NDAI_0F04160 [Naumovozyma dairenensis CBS 421]